MSIAVVHTTQIDRTSCWWEQSSGGPQAALLTSGGQMLVFASSNVVLTLIFQENIKLDKKGGR